MLKQGITRGAIAKELNIPLNTYHYIKWKHGIKLRAPYIPHERAKGKAKKLYDELSKCNNNYAELARKKGVSRERIRQLAWRYLKVTTVKMIVIREKWL